MIPGKAWSTPSKLCPCIRDKFFQLEARLQELNIAYKVLETMRDVERQIYYVNIGTSKTMNSKHLPQAPKELSLAVDLAPVEYMKLKHWNPNGILWETIRHHSREVGMICNIPWDKPHHQLNKCECPKKESNG